MSEATTLNTDTRASHPGGTKPNYFKWLCNYPTWPLLWLTPLVVFLVLAVTVHWLFWLPVAFFSWANRFYWRRIHDHFMFGCANPAMIVGMEPMLIATSTDLTKGHGEFPVVKIIEKRLKTANGQPPQLGTRLITVALYSQSPDDDGTQPRWRTFDPRPLDCVTSDIGTMQRLMSGFSDDEWAELDSYLEMIPRPRIEGQYLITEEGAVKEEISG